MTPTRRNRRARALGGPDAGLTLMELNVAMGIFAICLAIFVGAIVLMHQQTRDTQVAADASFELRKAFTVMDTALRYADGVNHPGTVGNSWFLEFRTPSRDTTPATCTQWRYDVAAGTFATRQWSAAADPSGTWRVLARGLSTNPAILTADSMRPFTMHPATLAKDASTGNGSTSQRVEVLLQSPTGRDATATQVQLRTTFVAINSSAASHGNTGTLATGSDTPVCSPSTARAGG